MPLESNNLTEHSIMAIDLAAIRAKILAAKQAKESVSSTTIETPTSPIQSAIDIQTSALKHGFDRFGNAITYNAAQSEFIALAATGKSCALIGAAGTGKTTTQRAAIIELIQSGMIPTLGTHAHSHLPSSDSLGIAICAFTRRATNNIRRNLTEDLQPNCLTIHKLLEYQPVDYETYDPESGKVIKTKRFEATRHADNPIPATIKTIIIEEASMVSIQLYQEIIAACPHKPQFIFLGDIQQLPPVFGAAILGFALSALPVIELTEVYRQALESPILALAHRILSGKPIPAEELIQHHNPSKGLILHPWKKQLSPDMATVMLAKFFLSALDKGQYNPEEDAILIPFNKSCGTIELNAHIANAIARKEQRKTYEILHGFLKSYYSEGDKCLYDKEDAIIRKIYTNPGYIGKAPLAAATNLNYWGHYFTPAIPHEDDANFDGSSQTPDEEDDDMDAILQSTVSADFDGDSEERTRAASHVIELYLLDSDRTVTIRSTGDMKKLDLGYAITVHKSQGSEWGKVFLCFHKSHATMLQRELLYTAVTRAKSSLLIICEKDSFEKGINGQRIQGNTLAEKAEYFKGKYTSEDQQPTFW